MSGLGCSVAAGLKQPSGISIGGSEALLEQLLPALSECRWRVLA